MAQQHAADAVVGVLVDGVGFVGVGEPGEEEGQVVGLFGAEAADGGGGLLVVEAVDEFGDAEAAVQPLLAGEVEQFVDVPDVVFGDGAAEEEFDARPGAEMVDDLHGTGEVARPAAHQVVHVAYAVQGDHEAEGQPGGLADVGGLADALDDVGGADGVGDDAGAAQLGPLFGDDAEEVGQVAAQGGFAAADADVAQAAEEGVLQGLGQPGRADFVVALLLPDVAHLAAGVADVVDEQVEGVGGGGPALAKLVVAQVYPGGAGQGEASAEEAF